MKKCPKCEEPKPETEFYRNRALPSGLTVYCKQHCREGIYQSRQARRRVMKEVERKQMALSPLTLGPPRERVRRAYERGITNRISIRIATGLTPDQVADAIAILNDKGVIRWNREKRVFRIAA